MAPARVHCSLEAGEKANVSVRPEEEVPSVRFSGQLLPLRESADKRSRYLPHHAATV